VEVIRILATQMGKQAVTNIIDEKLIDDEAALKNIVFLTMRYKQG